MSDIKIQMIKFLQYFGIPGKQVFILQFNSQKYFHFHLTNMTISFSIQDHLYFSLNFSTIAVFKYRIYKQGIAESTI